MLRSARKRHSIYGLRCVYALTGQAPVTRVGPVATFNRYGGITMKAAIISNVAPAAFLTQHPLWLESVNAAPDHRQAPPVHLTPRQLEVLSLLCEGLPNKLICRQLKIATGTVKVHVGIILKELGVSSRLQAVVAAQRCGLAGRL